MKIWHLDTVGSRSAVDGIASGLWVLAEAQVSLGHDVTLFVRTKPDPETRACAATAGITLVRVDRSGRAPKLALAPLRQDELPDVFHFHGAWALYHALVSSWLRSRQHPYIVTTHGGYGPDVLSSRRRERAAYLRLIEAPHVRGARAAVTTVRGEGAYVRAIVGTRCPVVDIPWPAETPRSVRRWEPDDQHPTAVFLGRFDVYQKGLDRLAALASLCPDVTFELYGLPRNGGRREMDRLVATAPANVRFRAPVHGHAKQSVLQRATVYVQPSRFEGFSLAVVDALLAGTPVVASEHLGLTDELRDSGAGGALPTDIPAAAQFLRAVMADRERLQAWSAAGRAFAERRFDAMTSAESYLSLYEDVVARSLR